MIKVLYDFIKKKGISPIKGKFIVNTKIVFIINDQF